MTEKDKLAELHDFLKHDVEVSFLDGDVIDVAMDVISKHIKMIKKLEKQLRTLHWRNEWIKSQEKIGHLEATVQDSKLENKRYREVLKEINQLWEKSTDATDDTNLAWKMSCEAHKALESESND